MWSWVRNVSRPSATITAGRSVGDRLQPVRAGQVGAYHVGIRVLWQQLPPGGDDF
jgi:hypothetical protein